jgi:hypothetical protein
VGSRDHSVKCETCGEQRGGLNNYKCHCEVLLQDDLRWQEANRRPMNRSYPHVTGVYGNQGKTPGALAIHAVLGPNENCPEGGRILVGAPGTSPTIPGYAPNLGNFSCDPDAAEARAATLTRAATEVRATLGLPPRAPADGVKLTDVQKTAIAESVITCYHNGTPCLRFCPLETNVFRFGLSINLRIECADGAFQIEEAKSAVVEYLVDGLESLLGSLAEQRKG